MISAALCVRQLTYGYHAPLFEPLMSCHQRGEIWAVLGRDGLGKNTLSDALTGTLLAIGGSIENNGGVGIVAQHSYLPFPYTVSDMVLIGRAQHAELFAQSSSQDQKRTMQAPEQLNIIHLAFSSFGSLSGGQQQLVTIVRALVAECQTLLLDGPYSALDPADQQAVLQLINDLAHRQGRSIVSSTHNPLYALQVASHILLLPPERRWRAGSTDSIVTEEDLFLAYGLTL